MTTTVTMLQTRQGEGGSLWTVGNSYSASDAFATVLINSNYATGTLPKSRGLVPVNAQTDSNGQITALVDVDGNSFLNGMVVSAPNGEFLDVILSAAIATARLIASVNRGRSPVIRLRGGDYSLSSTTATITIEPWMRIVCDGNVRIVATGQTVPVFWLRNDVAPQFSQGTESENNNGVVLDCRNGVIFIEGNKSAGGSGLRVGNGDGTWGTAYAGSNTYYTAFSACDNLHIAGMEAGVELTNNNAFCQRFSRLWLSDNVYNVRTSAAAVNVNAMEQSTFYECFMNEADTANIQINGGLNSSTVSSAHQLAFYGGSLTYSQGDNIQINTAAKARIELCQMRVENGDSCVRSTVLSPRSYVKLSNITLVPTKRSASLPPYMRKLFISSGGSAALGGDYVVQMDNGTVDLAGADSWSNTTISSAGNMFLADSEVVMQWGNLHATDPAGDIAGNNNMRVQPIPNSSAFLNQNSGFESGIATGWTSAGTGTWSSDSVAFYAGAKSAKLVCAAQYGSMTSEAVVVEAGRAYHGDWAMKVDPASASTNIYVIGEIEWLTADGTTILRTDTNTPHVSNTNAYNRRNDGWIRSALGTGLRIAPAGARFAKLRIHVSGGVAAGNNVNATVNLDQAGLVRLS